jgi:MGT family glycosyltransferase
VTPGITRPGRPAHGRYVTAVRRPASPSTRATGDTVHAIRRPITDPNPRQPLDPRDAGLLAEPGRPWVLLSLSTTQQRQAAALPGILDAVAALPVRVLLTLGGALPASAVDVPANVTVRGFVPHELLLPHMAAVISHGGLSTITAALTAGVPLVCIPQGRDQPDKAQRVAASGVGRVVATSAPPAEIATVLRELLADPAALRAARRFAGVIARLGGGDAATREVVRLARLRAPAGPDQSWSTPPTARLSGTR